MEIRLMKAGEADVVAQIVREAFRASADALGLTEAACPSYVAFEQAGGVTQCIERGATVALLLENETPIGTVRWYIHNGVGHVERLAVRPAYRKRGHGAALVAYAEAAMAQSGAHTAALSIVKAFTRLEMFYGGIGYVAARDARYDRLPFEVRHMEKAL